MKIVNVKNNKLEADSWVGYLLQPEEELTIEESLLPRWRESVKVFADVASGGLLVGNGDVWFSNELEGWNWLSANMPTQVQTVSDTVVDWPTMKNFYENNIGCYLNYLENSEHYCVWLLFRNQKLWVPALDKTSTEGLDFSTNFKSLCNVPLANEIRTRVCRYGRKQHCRYITIITANQDAMNNDNYEDVPYNDATYTMIDANRNVTLNNAEAKETWIDWMPAYSYEISGGAVYVPNDLPGDLDLWELHVVGAPEIPAAYGGSLQFLANPRIKWNRGAQVACDSKLDPAEAPYIPSVPANKIRFIFKHPVGAQVEFQIFLNIYK